MSNTAVSRHAPKPAILVTGASGGIGLATAVQLARQGNRVFAGVRSAATARTLRNAHGADLHPVILDVTDTASCRAALVEITDCLEGGHLTALVNNAGIAVQGPLETLPIEELIAQFEVNVFGVARMVQAALPSLRQAAMAGEKATIVNIGSIGGRIPIPFNGPYNASKFALVGYNGALRQELRPWGIRVVLVEPGTTRTAIWGKVEASLAQSFEGGAEHYSAMLESYHASVRALQRGGHTADYVAERIVKLIPSRSPAHRMLVGDARMMALLSFLPTKLRDILMGRGLRLPARGAALKSGL